MDSNSIENCEIAPDFKIGKLNTLLNSTLEEGTMLGSFSKIAYSKLGKMSYLGDQTIVINSIIKKFVSISWGVTIGPEEHDYSRLTNHSFLYSTKSFQLVKEKKYSPFEKECIIGNDVWIGCNSTILRGVTIGDGAVIGANSLVNTDIPPYSIAVGSPAKIIKFRFEKEIIDALILLQWWDLPLSIISEHADLFAENPSLESIKKLEKIKKTLI
ncbi:MAG: CatB-related O-acetyltransferase [Flavobacteriia bacterium]|jgi:virginiamycin A acetyltransferase